MKCPKCGKELTKEELYLNADNCENSEITVDVDIDCKCGYNAFARVEVKGFVTLD